MAEWLIDTIATGLQKLHVLSLDRTPGHDTIRGTALAWYEALTHDQVWVESRDRTRIEHAFRTLSRTVTRWPSPAELLRALPPSDQRRISGPGARPADPDYLVAAMRDPKTPRVTSLDG